MKIFVIHRFKDRKQAKKRLRKIAKDLSLKFKPIFLNSSGNGVDWKYKAENEIRQSEVVIVYNLKSCEESENAQWEIKKTKEAGKEIIALNEDISDSDSICRLKSIYELNSEFESCFTSSNKDIFELYKIMIESSENLIQRRQKTNAFFITVIGSLLAIAGLLVKTGAISSESISIMYGFSAVGLLLCNSWRNLIDNYGKLNKAKFDVILRLEKDLNAEIFSAEWVALGKGLRPQKYKSFTSTEKNVPLYFSLLIFVLTAITVAWQIWGEKITEYV